MSLITEFRPDDLQNFMGSEDAIKGLKSKFDSKNPPNVFLITGPSGCGKTTLSRIIATLVGAIKDGESPHISINYKEIDSAHFTGVDSIRDLRRQLPTLPMANKTKAYLLDECHQLSFAAQEALLKGLEECPKHAYIILATTDPQKLKVTLKRRCHEVKLSSLNDDDMHSFLASIVKKRKAKKVNEKVITEIANSSMGSPGIALSILDKVIDLKNPKAMLKVLATGETISTAAIDLCRGIFKKTPWNKMGKIIKALKDNKQDPERLRKAINGYCMSILLKQDSAAAYMVMDAMKDPFYDSPWESLVRCLYYARYAEED